MVTAPAGMRLKTMSDSGVKIEIIDAGKGKSQHNKFMIIDEAYVFTGSYNFTTRGSKANSENVILVKSTKVAKQFNVYWQKMKSVKKN